MGKFFNKKRGPFPSNLDQLYTIVILNYLEQVNAPVIIFLKIVACPSTYKKKLEEAIVIEILYDLLIFKFDTFVKAEFIFKILNLLKH